jgi:hypothetical protein
MLKCKECGVVADQLEQGFKKNCACECGVIMDMGHVKLKGLGTIKEAILFPRDVKRLSP